MEILHDAPKALPLDSKKIYQLISKILPGQCFILGYMDENNCYQFLAGEMELQEYLAMKAHIEIEMLMETFRYYDITSPDDAG